MDRIIGNLSIYDVLSMVIPGGTLLLFLQVLFAADSYPLSVLINKEQELDRTILLTIGTVVSYIVGIFNHLLTTMIWGGFRNNTAYIKRELIKVMRETPDPFYLKLLCGSMNTTTATSGLQNTIDAYLRGPFWFVWSIFVCCSILQLVSDFCILNFDCIYIIGSFLSIFIHL